MDKISWTYCTYEGFSSVGLFCVLGALNPFSVSDRWLTLIVYWGKIRLNCKKGGGGDFCLCFDLLIGTYFELKL